MVSITQSAQWKPELTTRERRWLAALYHGYHLIFFIVFQGMLGYDAIHLSSSVSNWKDFPVESCAVGRDSNSRKHS